MLAAPRIKPKPLSPVKHKRYPRVEEPIVTIGIGVLCCTAIPVPGSGKFPDTLIMVADTMGSNDYDSTDELRKIFTIPDVKLYAVSSGKMETAGEIVAAVAERLPLLPARTHGTVWKLLNEVVNGHRAERFRFDVIAPRYEMLPGKVQVQDHANVIREYQEYNVGVDLIFGTFDDNGKALLFEAGKAEESAALVRPVAFPGYYAVGSGSWLALSWLNYRGQRLGFTTRRSALHAYEAARMASATPTVNDKADVVIATASSVFILPHDQPPTPNSPLTLQDLKKLAGRYGPRGTKAL